MPIAEGKTIKDTYQIVEVQGAEPETQVTMLAFSSPDHFVSAITPNHPVESGFWFVFSKDLILVTDTGDLPSTSPKSALRQIYLGQLGGVDLIASEMETSDPPEGFTWKPLRSLHGLLPDDLFALAGRAMQLLEWDQAHQYCGRCAHPTTPRKDERSRECPQCTLRAYPKLAPVIMVLVKRKNQILLARGPQSPSEMFSVLAGFVDPGETLEQAVHREVFEEVGLHVKNLSYHSSQSWPFSGALMIGFIADWAEGEITFNSNEIESASWYSQTELPMLPTPMSLAWHLVQTAFT